MVFHISNHTREQIMQHQNLMKLNIIYGLYQQIQYLKIQIWVKILDGNKHVL